MAKPRLRLKYRLCSRRTLMWQREMDNEYKASHLQFQFLNGAHCFVPRLVHWSFSGSHIHVLKVWIVRGLTKKLQHFPDKSSVSKVAHTKNKFWTQGRQTMCLDSGWQMQSATSLRLLPLCPSPFCLKDSVSVSHHYPFTDASRFI